MTPDAENYHDQPDILEERLSAYLDGMLDALAGLDEARVVLAGVVRRMEARRPSP